ncbi:hypothetical protein ACHHYP_00989 [Achlya hypogyna]|uniref:Uncharacterized protein n=1 Tax=Achlya hypogyna TaxID=1202772 RepID=A0A1V9Z9T4_ACHHY|nr:hypothetical protein ACHHYP_00989 [Achlya hypogyna]
MNRREESSPSKEAGIRAAQLKCESQLMARDFHAAYTTIVACVQDAVAIYGKHGLPLVPYYLLMAEVGLELGHLKQVEEVLALSIWNIVKSAEDMGEGETHPGTLMYRALVCKFYGRFHCEAENFDEALKQAANGAYYASLVHGPEHVRTSALYFTLGTTFQRMFRTEHALGMFDKIVEIWYKYLAAATRPPSPSLDAKAAPVAEVDGTLERLHHEGASMLLHIFDTRAKVLGAAHIATGEVQYTMGLLRLHMGQRSEAKGFLDQALVIYTDALGSLHPSTIDVQSVVDQLRMA